MTLLPTANGSGLSQEFEGRWPESPAMSPCVAGVIPVIYYSILLGLGLPGPPRGIEGGLLVGALTLKTPVWRSDPEGHQKNSRKP